MKEYVRYIIKLETAIYVPNLLGDFTKVIYEI